MSKGFAPAAAQKKRDVEMTEKKQKKLPLDPAEYEKLVQMCLAVIRNKDLNILFITDLVAFLPISRATFYNYGLDKLDILKEEIDNNRIRTKQVLRAKWAKSKSPALQIALYRMIATKEEKAAISILPAKETEKQEIDLPIKQMFESLKQSIKERTGAESEGQEK